MWACKRMSWGGTKKWKPCSNAGATVSAGGVSQQTETSSRSAAKRSSRYNVKLDALNF